MRHDEFIGQMQNQNRAQKQKWGETDTTALVTKLFRKQDYGCLKTLVGEEIYFHRNSVLHGDFDRLEVGTGMRFEVIESEEELRATTVQIVDKPGVEAGKAEETLIEPPLS
jgi:cold shock CspA family protein